MVQASGLIIGRGGESIREMVEKSGSKIQLTAKEKQIPGLDERVLTCSGSVPQVWPLSKYPLCVQTLASQFLQVPFVKLPQFSCSFGSFSICVLSSHAS